MSSPIVHAPCGPVAGIERPGSLAFLGIPYAEVPFGANRFRAPVARAAWKDTFDATHYGATPQRRAPFENPAIPEPIVAGDDILNLNVFTPTTDADAKLPVHVYIHGGGYIAGSHVGSWFDGATYNVDGIVVVTLSYRLGFEGFGWIADAPRNRGMLDMVCALEWVRDNITAFGGDPARVTISGQSAGGGAVLTLLAMPAAQGLFHGVIAHSPVIGASTAAEHEARGRAFATRAGVQPTVAGWSALTEDEVLDVQFAQMVEGERIHPMASNIKTTVTALGEVTMAWAPALDPDTLPVAPFEAWANGFNRDVHLLIGATADEFVFPPVGAPAEAVRAWLDDSGLPEPYVRYALDAIAAGDPDPIGRLGTAVMFRRNVLDVAAVRRSGGAQAWMYDFVHASSVSGLSGHCLELPFTWNCLADAHVTTMLGPDQPQGLADAMHGAWVAFVRDGAPGWAEGTGRVFGGTGARQPYEDVEGLVQALPKV